MMPLPIPAPYVCGLMAGVALSLAACGGGGGDSPPPPPPPATFNLSGVIRAPSGTAMDSDVNDPLAPFAANDVVTNAQAIPNPVTLGGYANIAGAGPAGRSQATGDPVDIYRVDLQAGQNILLLIAEDGQTNDLDLLLADDSGQVITASAGQTTTESIVVPQAGSFLVAVRAFSGASAYVLLVGQQLPTLASGPGTLSLSRDFVPGEVVAKFTEDGFLAASAPSLEARAQALGMAPKAGAPGRNMLLGLAGPLQAQAAPGTGASATAFGGLVFEPPSMRRKWDTLMAVKGLRGRADVETAEPNYLRKPLRLPNDEFFTRQWHFPQIKLPQAWDITLGANVIVAVVDTGVLLAHPDLQGQLVSGFDFITDPDIAGDGDGPDPNPDDPGDRVAPSGESSFHGTHVAGVVAAASNNGIGVAGAAWSAKIMPLRALGVAGGTDFDIAEAVRFAAGLPNSSGTLPAQRADIINMSLGSTGFSTTLEQAINEARDAGAVIVAAAGNEASTTPFIPASLPGVISVSAVDAANNLAPYSNFGPTIDVAAPGGNLAADVNGDGFPDGIISTGANDASGAIQFGYPLKVGTSIATPSVSGVIALMKAVNPGLTPQQVDDLLASGTITEDLGPPGRDDQYGHGLIDAFQAVSAAIDAAGGNVPPPIPTLVVSPTALNFGVVLTNTTLSLTNGGGGALNITAVSEDSGGWLSLAPTVDASGLGTYTVTVNRANLADGTYTATITFQSSANTVQVPVIMQVSTSANLSANAGFHYVLLIDPETAATLQQDPVAVSNGLYSYGFSGVAEGTYQIFAGSDSDNDGSICDPGEACGAFITVDQPQPIAVNADRGGLDFDTGFRLTLVGAASTDGGVARPPSAPILKRLEGGR